MELPGVNVIMHPHDKARLDGAIQRANREKREREKKEARLAALAGNRTVAFSPLMGAPFAPETTPTAEPDVYKAAVEKNFVTPTGRLSFPELRKPDMDPRFGADDAGKAELGRKE